MWYPAVSVIDQQVDSQTEEINEVNDQYIPFGRYIGHVVFVQQFWPYSGYISGKDEKQE